MQLGVDLTQSDPVIRGLNGRIPADSSQAQTPGQGRDRQSIDEFDQRLGIERRCANPSSGERAHRRTVLENFPAGYQLRKEMGAQTAAARPPMGSIAYFIVDPEPGRPFLPLRLGTPFTAEAGPR